MLIVIWSATKEQSLSFVMTSLGRRSCMSQAASIRRKSDRLRDTC